MLRQLKNREYLLELTIFSLITAILHYLALVNFLYWNVSWFDILMHFLGGVTMGFLALFIFFTSRYLPKFSALRDNKLIVFYVVISFTFIIGLGWELWEIFSGFSNVFNDKVDTLVDLIMDTLGALTVFFIEIKRNK